MVCNPFRNPSVVAHGIATVTFGGAILFLVFAVYYFHEAWASSDSPAVHILHPEHANNEVDWVHA
jgi:hypothetical protein